MIFHINDTHSHLYPCSSFGKYLGELKVDVDRGSGRVEILNYRLNEFNSKIKKDKHLLEELKELKIGFEMDPRFGKVCTEHIATAKWNLKQESDPNDSYRDTALME